MISQDISLFDEILDQEIVGYSTAEYRILK